MYLVAVRESVESFTFTFSNILEKRYRHRSIENFEILRWEHITT